MYAARTPINVPFYQNWWNTSLARCISLFIHPSKPIRKTYPNQPKTHKIENLVLIAEDKNKIRINSGVSNVYTFSHADIEGVEFYNIRCYFEIGGNIGRLLCKWWRGRILWSDDSFIATFVGRTKGVWCWNFGFTMFGFRA